MSYKTSDSFLEFPHFLWLSFRPFPFVVSLMNMRLRISIQFIEKGYYIAISSTMVTPPRLFLISFVVRGHMLNGMLGHVVLSQKLIFFRSNKLISGELDLFVHVNIGKPYILHIHNLKDLI